MSESFDVEVIDGVSSKRRPKGGDRIRSFMGPGQVDHQIRQAIQFAWMMLPDERKSVTEVERVIRQVVDRAFKNFRVGRRIIWQGEIAIQVTGGSKALPHEPARPLVSVLRLNRNIDHDAVDRGQALDHIHSFRVSAARHRSDCVIPPSMRGIHPQGRNAMPALHGASEMPTSLVQGYEILQTLNEGGMGKIYLARQHALNRLVCVKVLSIPAGEDADLCRSRFCREAELLASVSHPHILSIFDFGTTADLGLPFLVTEYIEAGDLRRRMSSGQSMPVERGTIHRTPDRRRTDALAQQGDPSPRPEARKHPHADRLARQGGRLRHRRHARQGRALDPIRPRNGDGRLRLPRAAIRPEG